MIKVALMGGLGNQMSQYAFGRSIAHELGDELTIDKSYYYLYYINRIPRKYELKHFNLKCHVINFNPISFLRTSLMGKITFDDSFIDKITNTQYIYDSGNFCEDTIHEIMTNNAEDLYLVGTWVDYRYFYKNLDLIRKDLEIISPQSIVNQKIMIKIQNTEAICLHIRRGDFVSLGMAYNADYYNHAINLISEKVDNPVFYIFSDDFNWVKDNININYPFHYMIQNGPDMAYEDIRLMTNCKHFITTNSSFGWWGAILGTFDNKIVISPKELTNSPLEWIKI